MSSQDLQDLPRLSTVEAPTREVDAVVEHTELAEHSDTHGHDVTPTVAREVAPTGRG
jgi:hypothetical protein